MKRSVTAFLVVAGAVAACDQPFQPPKSIFGSISVDFSRPESAVAVSDSTGVAPAASDGTQQAEPGAITKARIILTGQSAKNFTVDVPVGGTTVRLDSLRAGSGYVLTIEGLVNDSVDTYGRVDNITVASGQQTTVNIGSPTSGVAWGSVRPVMQPVAGSPTTAFRMPVSWTAIAAASGYTVQWSKDPAFPAAGLQSLTPTAATAALTVADTGTFHVRVKATVASVPNARWSDVVTAQIVASASGGGDAGSAQPVPANAGVIDTLITGLNLVPTSLQDWFSINACREDTLRVETFAARLGPPSPLNTLVRLFRNDGTTQEAFNDDLDATTTDSRILEVLPVDGAFKVLVTQTSATNGHYNVQLRLSRGAQNTGTSCVPPGPASVDLSSNLVGFSALGATATLTASARDSIDRPLTGITFAWATRNGAVAAVNPTTGLITSISNGSTYIVATATGGPMGPVSDSALVAILQLPSRPQSIVTLADSTVSANTNVTATLTARDSLGSQLLFGGLTVVFNNSGGTSTGSMGTVTDNGNGTYTVPFKGHVAGTPTSIGATMNGLAVTSALPVVRVKPGAPKKLYFREPPAGGTAGENMAPAIEVVARDTFNNQLPTMGNAVTVTIGNNPAGGTLFGNVTRVFTAGVASFNDLRIDSAGSGYTLIATHASIAPDTSVGFDIFGGAASKLGFVVQPATTGAGIAIAPPIQVAVQDDLGNTVTGAVNQVTLVLSTNPAGSVLSGTVTRNAVAGIATFNNISLDKIGTGYGLKAGATGLDTAASNLFNITGGTPARLAITVEPGNAQAGQAISPAIQVTVLDAGGNPIADATDSITVAVLNNPGAATLSGTYGKRATAGVASFGNLSLNKTGAGYTLRVTSGSLVSDTSVSFNISPADPYQLAFGVQPTTVTSGAIVTPHPTVLIRDAFGNNVTTATNVVALAIGTNPAGGTLFGTTSQAAVGGIATFDNLSIDQAGIGYALSATSSGLLTTPSDTFRVLASATISPSQSTVQVNPASGVRVMSDTATVTVTVRDPAGNPIQAQTVQLDASGLGNLIIPPAENTNASGVAVARITSTMAELKTLTVRVNPSGANVTLDQQPTVEFVADTEALSPTLSTATANPAPPDSVVADGIQTSIITVTVRDTLNNPVPGREVELSNTCVGCAGTLTQPGPTNGSGVTTGSIRRSTAGNDTITVTVNPSGNPVVLSQTPAVKFAADTLSLDVNLSTVDVAYSGNTFPGDTALADGLDPVSLTVTILDNLGAPIAGDSVWFELSGTGNTITQPSQLTDAGGIAVGAVRSTVAEDKILIVHVRQGVQNRILAAQPTLVFKADIAAALAFKVQPANSAAGVAISPFVQVAVVDAHGNTVTDDVRPITIDTLYGSGPDSLYGTKTVNAVGGIATFTDLSIRNAANGYQLRAHENMLGSATSTAFNVTAASPARVAFQLEPSTTPAGSAIAPAIEVKIVDAFGNTATTATNAVTMAIIANPGTAVLSGTTTRNAVAGIATFNNLTLDKTGGGYTLGATSSGLVSDTSATFNVTAALATRLRFTVQPASATAGTSITSVQVAVQDAFGNTVTSDADPVTISIGDDPSGGIAVLSGTTVQSAVSGIATFNNLSLDRSGVNYSLRATRGGLTQDFSTRFNITAAGASQLAFSIQPTVAVAGVSINPAVRVTARDPFGNTATTFTDVVTMAMQDTATTGAVLSGTKQVTAVSGIANFTSLNIDKAGTGYTLRATATGLTGATSNAHNITPAAARRVAFIQQPTVTVAGEDVTPAIQVAVQDTFGNHVPTGTNAVSLTILDNPGGGSLLGQTTVSAVGGFANFNDVTLDKRAVDYTLLASATSLIPDTSATFSITAGAPSDVASSVSANPTTGIYADDVQLSTITVVVRDSFANPAPGHTVTLGATGNGNTITPPGSPTDDAGETVGFLTSTVAESKTITATVDGSVVILETPSVVFVADTGVSATLSSVVVGPGTIEANGSTTATVTVTVRDRFNNLLPGKTAAIALSGPGNTITQPPAPSDAAGLAIGAVASTKAETKTITVTIDGKILQNQPTIAFVPGPSAQLGFVVAPTDLAAGSPMTPGVQVAVQDAHGNTVDTATAPVTVGLSGGTANSSLYGTQVVAAINGIATFTNLTVDSVGTGYELLASAPALSDTNSTPFAVIPGAVYTIAITPGTDSLFVLGGTRTLTPLGRDSVGNAVPAAVFSWTSTNEPVATVDPSSGLITALSRGLAVIEAHSGGKTGSANLAVAVRVAEVTTSDHAPLFATVFDSNLPGRYEAISEASYNALSIPDLRAAYDVLIFGNGTDGSADADWVTRIRPFLQAGGGVLFESPSNAADIAPAVTAVAQSLTSNGIALLSTPSLTEGVTNAFNTTDVSFTSWTDSLAHFMVRGDTALGLYGRFGNACVVLTGPSPSTYADLGGDASQINMHAFLRKEIQFAADCPLNASPGASTMVRVFPSSANFTDVGQQVTPRASALDNRGTPIPDALFTWSSSNTNVALVNPGTGVVTSTGSGQVSIGATNGGSDYLLATVNVPPAPLQNAWGIEQAPNVLSNNYLLGAWGTDANNIFVTGFGGAIRRYNGISWDTLNSGTSAQLWRVWGTDNNDVFTVGSGGTILHYDGSNWTTMANPLGSSNQLYGVWGTSPRDVFAVGYNFSDGFGLILHYDGVEWEQVNHGLSVSVLYGVWGTSPRNVYVVGQDAVLHYDGASWSQVATGDGYELLNVWGSGPNDVWASSGGGPLFKHYDGSSWSTVASPAIGGEYMYGMWGSSASEIYAVGAGGTILRYNGTTWSRMASPFTTDYVLALWGTSSDRLLAVGGQGTVLRGVRGAVPTSVAVTPSGATATSIGETVNFNARIRDAGDNLITPSSAPAWSSENTSVATVAPVGGIATAEASGQAAIKATYTGIEGYGVMTVAATGSPPVDAFAIAEAPTGTAIWDVWGSSATNAFAVGSGGGILRYDGASWTTDPQSGVVTTNQLYSVAGTSGSDVHAVGANGTLLHYNGSTWSVQPNPFGTALAFRVWAVAPNAAYAGLTNGYVLKWDGTAWDSLPQFTPGVAAAVLGIWASSPNDVWAASNNGTIRRWDGTQWIDITHPALDYRQVWGTSSNNVYVTTGSGTVLQCSANNCAALPTSPGGFLWDIWGTSASEVFAVNNSGTLFRWNGGSWTTMFTGYGAALRGLWGTSSGTVFAVGENVSQPILRGARGAPVQSYGYPTAFPGTSYGWWTPGDLASMQITITDTLAVTHLGLHVHTAGSTAKLAIYTDVAGNPGALITQGEGSVAAAGAREIAVTRVTLLPGTYWMASNFLNATYIQANIATPITYKYRSGYGYATALPAPFGAPSTTTYQATNYYIKGFGF